MLADDGSNLVSTAWLAEHLDAPDVVVLDGSFHLPDAGRDAALEFRTRHIPGAVPFDIEDVSDPDSKLPHMLPRPEIFASKVRRLGIGDGQTIVAYDSVGLFSAARVWWMFRAMGAPSVFVLDGGLPRWIAEGRPVEEGPARPRMERHFTARLDHLLIADADAVAAALANGSADVLDARPPDRFCGIADEPRPGVRRGHMPGASNIHYGRLLDADGRLKSRAALRGTFAEAGLDPARPAITSCGSGVTAAIISLALAELGNRAAAVYDGSWSEWGSDDSRPVVQGP